MAPSNGRPSRWTESGHGWLQFVLAVVTTAVLGGVAWGQINARINAFAAALRAHVVQAAHPATGRELGEVREAIRALDQRLRRIEQKLDRLAEGR